jgi:curved DNA-binding protein CbpA
VPNHFAALELPARPWIEPEVLKEAFHRLGAARHPDAPGGEADAFSTVNAAWQVLRDPAQRLRHLLELEGAPAASTQIPPTLADTFMSLAALRRRLDDFVKRQAAASGALAKALLASERTDLGLDLRSTLTQLDECIAQALQEVRAIDAAWPARDAATITRLAISQQSLAFLGKWSDQLREALYRLGA